MNIALSVIIVTWNSRRDIEKCLASLERHSNRADCEVIIFDNASTDGTADFVKENFPRVRLLPSTANCGFGRANNRAAQQATGKYLLFLNPDTWVDGDLTGDLIAFLNAHPEAGACAPRILDPDGSIQFGSMRTLPTLETLFYDQTGLSRFFPASRRFGRYRMTWWRHDDLREVEQPAGACFAVRRELFEHVGGFDEDYFMYFEDVELCHAILSAGSKIYFVPEARVYHLGGQSTSQAVVKNFPEFYRSMYAYFRKRHGRIKTWLAKLIVGAGEMAKLLAWSLVMPFKKFLPRPKFWASRREQLVQHGRFFLQHWFY